MTWLHALVGLIMCLPAYFVWSLLHELSHMLATKVLVGLDKWELKPWPHRVDGVFMWGSFQCQPHKTPTKTEDTMISLAPRVPDLLAVLLFPLLTLFSGYGQVVWFVVWGAGLVDLIFGSIGFNAVSDLRTAATNLKWSPWILRLAGMGATAVSIVTGLLLVLL